MESFSGNVGSCPVTLLDTSNVWSSVMRVDQLHSLIQKFAQDEENLRTDVDQSVIWDFVAADVHMSEEYKSSDFTADDVEEALHQVSERWGV